MIPASRFVCYNVGTHFDLVHLRLRFTALDSIHFTPGHATNLLRGTFGLALESADYARLFAPRTGSGPSGLTESPRPFVFRARHLDGLTFRPGQAFHFDLNVFLDEPAALEAICTAFAAAAAAGIGPGRGRAAMQAPSTERVSLALDPAPHTPAGIRVDFLSPIELKDHGRIASQPDFPVLFARIRDRISTLRQLYGPGPLGLDFAAIGDRAAAVSTTCWQWRHVEIDRLSSRTGQSHSIGGFTGFAEYEGPLAEFLPYLEAARWTGVGRHAVWGKGEITISPPAAGCQPSPAPADG